ncbi:CBS-domain-containing protein [Dichomitus squalens LYAD-421 SS1]|uniref:CBS-domain-containing protein n=2 Tax=Polyporaceae TaxID=5317 RepID=A0A4Q9N7W5_9APHY|nr:CBS-domain-containing protein [Dichomitus squalens LYAD-421 SS1]EJF66493.1 CBS-domain-containing protein [Dichomitus squalens LYAD-421 SS1]TBU35016.1 CBS-domain-containing protein [Dichomitus squalens]
MSRIPVPSPSYNRSAGAPRATSPIPFPADRAVSPLPSRHQPNSSMSTLSSSVAETRRKQNKRDEAIRKKIEGELARKRTISTTGPGAGGGRRRRDKPNVQKGTVAALKPSPALTVPENITVSEASQLCAAKRTDCVLVVDDDEGLSGIFTAKDLAYRVTAEGLDPHTTQVSVIMTRNPMVTRDTTSATEALQLMVQKHFRHLPVCNEEGNVVGLLDITKVFHEALDKVERSSSASEKLYSALAGVQSELGAGLGSNPQAAAMLSYVEALREKTALPDLTTVMDSRTQPATVGPKTTVREVAKLMKERRTTAVCVMEPAAPGHTTAAKIAGIFTSKDIVLRVIAAGLDATRCSVVRVMTPHPDTAPPTMTIHDALKKMHIGHYLNLPVVEADGRLVAIVDVLKLTYATLEQMNAMSVEAGGENEPEGGPMWGRFFESLGAGDDTESVLSGSHYHADSVSHSRKFSRSMSHLVQSPHSEVHPNDSASVVDDDQESALAGYGKQDGVPSIVGPPASIPPVDDGTYVFKFRTPSGRTHRFQARHDNVETLREIVGGKLATDPFFTNYKNEDPNEPPPDPTDFTLSYTDADGDVVLITSDSDVSDAVKIARAASQDRVVLFIQGGRGWADAMAEKSARQAEAVAAAAAQEVKEVEKTEVAPAPTPSVVTPAPSVYAPPPYVPHPPAEPELVLGIPKDLLLPASIGALAAVILGVFTISRLTR